MEAQRDAQAALAMVCPAGSASPFEGLYRLEAVTTSTVIAEGPGTGLEFRFKPDPKLAAVARLMALHCAGLRSPIQ